MMPHRVAILVLVLCGCTSFGVAAPGGGDASIDDGGASDGGDRRDRRDGALDAGAGRLNDANGHRYLVVRSPAPISWAAARDAAKARGGHLATVTSASENEFIFNLLKNDDTVWGAKDNFRGPWLGGAKPSAGAPWGWITDEPFQYKSWAVGEPNNTGSAAFLIFFDRARLTPTWGDEDLDGYDDVVSFIVEFE